MLAADGANADVQQVAAARGEGIREPRVSLVDMMLGAALLAGVGHAAYFLIAGLDRPLMDLFQFRQTQTAITTYWLTQGGPWIAYQTPVLGAPWSIPFEFPTYQLIVAALSSAGVPMDAAGRIVAFAFFLGCLAPTYWLFRDLGFGRTQYLVFAILFVLSPLYVFWSRTFMIESAALFFGIAWLALIVRFSKSTSLRALGFAIVAGALGILTKSTTFAPFGLLAGIAICVAALGRIRGSASAGAPRVGLTTARIVLGGGVACAVVLAIGLGWVGYTDQVKAANPLADFIRSDRLHNFNYGPLELKWSARFWDEAILNRALPEIFGPMFLLAFVALGAAPSARRHFWVALAAFGSAMFSLLFVTNLHRVHNYYQYANAVFLIAAVALGIGALASAKSRVAAAVLLVAIMTSQAWMFHTNFRPAVLEDTTSRSHYRTGMALRQRVSPDQAVLVFGNTWSSDVQYYAQRKGITVPGQTPDEFFKTLLEGGGLHLGGMKLGAVVVCDPKQYGRRAEWVTEMASRLPLLEEVGACKIYGPEPLV